MNNMTWPPTKNVLIIGLAILAIAATATAQPRLDVIHAFANGGAEGSHPTGGLLQAKAAFLPALTSSWECKGVGISTATATPTSCGATKRMARTSRG